MKKLLIVLICMLSAPLFGQQAQQGLQIIMNNIDTTYMDEEGYRWQEFTTTELRAYTIMDLFEADTTCGCDVIKGHRNYVAYLKENDMYKNRIKKLERNIIGHLYCKNTLGYTIVFWMQKDYNFGMIVNSSL